MLVRVILPTDVTYIASCHRLALLMGSAVSVVSVALFWVPATCSSPCRGVLDGRRGWSVLLKEHRNRVELQGHDYVMDLICDLELMADFPRQKSYFISSSEDPSQTKFDRRM